MLKCQKANNSWASTELSGSYKKKRVYWFVTSLLYPENSRKKNIINLNFNCKGDIICFFSDKSWAYLVPEILQLLNTKTIHINQRHYGLKQTKILYTDVCILFPRLWVKLSFLMHLLWFFHSEQAGSEMCQAQEMLVLV